jgi:OmcA/MtrC family decaheme c-type cytochrome
MNRFDALKRWTWSVFIVFTLAFAFAGCEGDDGAQGPQGEQGPPGADGQDGQDGADGTDATIDPVAAAKVESCGTCHGGAGEFHQAIYDKYTDESAFVMTFTDFTVGPGAVAGTFDGTLNVTILKNGEEFENLQALVDGSTANPKISEAYFAVVDYDGPNQDYSLGRQALTTITQPTPGNYVITGTGLTFDPTVSGQVYGYIAETPLFEHTGSAGSELPEGTHVHLYDDVANAALAFGDAQTGSANEYASAANVSGCNKCHGTPYLKHGFRAAEVAGLPDFSACKTCHYSGRNGFVEEWQYMVDEPLNWATGVTPVVDYTYEGSIMNDTHMSHAMEFPYPQSMQNCATCHEGKIDTILADANFTQETCLSCHPVQGIDAWPKTFNPDGTEIVDSRGRSVPGKYYQANRAPALDYLWFVAGVDGFDFHVRDGAQTCQSCHGVRPEDGGTGFASQFTAFHTGYDVNITDENGVRYSDAYTVNIAAASYDPETGKIFVRFTGSDPAIVPELYLSFYGWDSKNFIVAGHERDANDACGSPPRVGCQMEYVPESSGGSPNPIFTEGGASTLGDWRVTVDPSQWQLTKTDDIPTMIANGTIRRVEVMVAPELNLSNLATPGPDLDVVLTGKSLTLNLVTGSTENDYFSGPAEAVSTEKCNACHDALASSFHSESGRGGDGIQLCKNCHNVTYPGSHLEMASRSIDNYVHAIHSFQEFDVEDVFNEDGEAAFDPVFAARYDQHINHVFPNFTIRNCEACHVEAGANNGAGGTYPVVYNVPDPSKSMPSVLSASDDPLTWYDIDPTTDLAVERAAGRAISGSIPEFVTGAASRACGGCHRARFINRDLAGDLAAWNAHTEAFGTYVENGPVEEGGDEDGVLYGVIFKIMELFE